MKKLITILYFLIIISTTVIGQFQIDWQQSYGGSKFEYADDIVQTGEEYIVAGRTESNDGQVNCNYNNGASWLIKIDYSGNEIWQKCIESGGVIRMFNVTGSTDIYLVGGTRSDPYPDAYNLWAARIDSSANIIWERTLGNHIGILAGDQYGEPTPDGGLIASAQIDSEGGDISNFYGGYDGWMIKLDSNGNTDWDFTIGASTTVEFINCIIPCGDGGYLAGLYGNPQGGGSGNVDCIVQNFNKPDAIVFKLDANANAEWHRCYGGSGHDGVGKLLETEDGYMIAAFGGSNDGDLEGSGWHGGNDVWLIRIDFEGNIIWQKCYGGSGSDVPKKIFQTSDAGFMVFANTWSFDGDVTNNPSNAPEWPSIWVFKINGLGELIWQQCIGGGRNERVNGVVQHSDIKYAVAGEMSYSPSGDVNCSNYVIGSSSDYWVFGISDTMVGIRDEEIGRTGEEERMELYPNPATTELQLRFSILDFRSSIFIYDLYGRKQDEINIPKGHEQTRIDVSTYPSGIYIAVMKDEKGVVARGKFVKR